MIKIQVKHYDVNGDGSRYIMVNPQNVHIELPVDYDPGIDYPDYPITLVVSSFSYQTNASQVQKIMDHIDKDSRTLQEIKALLTDMLNQPSGETINVSQDINLRAFDSIDRLSDALMEGLKNRSVIGE